MAESNREEIAKLEALYANNPGGRVFTHLAEAYRKAGELDRARQILEDGITRHAEYASAHVVLGRVLQDQGARAEASAAFRRVLDLDPENRVALRSLGDLAREGDQREEALAYFRQLLSLDPTDDQLVRIIDQINAAIHADDAEPLPTIEADAARAAGPAPSEESSGTEEPDFAESTSGSHTSRTEELTALEDIRVPETAASGTESAASEPAEPDAAEPEAAEPFRVETFVGADPTEFHVDAAPEDESSPAASADTDLEEYVTPDIRLDWDSEGVPHGESPALPGDLAAFAEAKLPEKTDQPADAVEDAMSEVGEFVDLGEEAAPGDEPTFENMLSSSGSAKKLQPEAEPVELKTETLAELYLSQGFNDRAAEVYRSLLERNPGDERLQRRLADVEAKLAEADEWSGDDADTLDTFWTGGGEPATVEPTLYAWTETEEPAGPSIGTFFGELLSWRPGAENGHSPAEAELPGSTVEPVPSQSGKAPSSIEAQAAVEAQAPVEARAAVEVPAAVEAQASDEVSAHAEAQPSGFAEVPPVAKEGGEPDTAFQEVATDVPGPGESAFEEVEAPKNTDAFVANESATPLSTAGMLSQFSAPLNEVEAAFEEWFSGVPSQPKPSAEAAPPAASPSTAQVQPAPAPVTPEPKPVAPAPSAEARPAAPSMSSEESEDDEDLEMFRSWLQSLKR